MHDTFDKPIKMKLFLPLIMAVLCLPVIAQELPASHADHAKTKKLFIITIDGFRWQEVFTGADPLLVGNPEYVRDTLLTRQLYWDSSTQGAPKKAHAVLLGHGGPGRPDLWEPAIGE